MTTYAYGINLQNGNIEKYMQIDSFTLPNFYYKDINGYYFGNYFAINFFKVLSDHKLFMSTITNYRCDTIYGSSYLIIFGLTSSGIHQNKNMDGKMDIYPNPNNGIFTIDFESKNNANIQLQLVDITGNIIYQENKAHQAKTTFSINQTNLAKGVYWIKLSDGNDVYSNGIIVQ